MRKIAFSVRHKRLDFRAIMTDFDRTTKTRSGTYCSSVAAVAVVWSPLLSWSSPRDTFLVEPTNLRLTGIPGAMRFAFGGLAGSTPHNYTLLPGCISRSQFQQALAKMQLEHLVDTETLTSFYKRYDREVCAAPARAHSPFPPPSPPYLLPLTVTLTSSSSPACVRRVSVPTVLLIPACQPSLLHRAGEFQPSGIYTRDRGHGS